MIHGVKKINYTNYFEYFFKIIFFIVLATPSYSDNLNSDSTYENQTINTNDILGVYSDEMKSFDEPPYFSPLMIYDFAGLPSDGGDEVLISSIDLISALTSERYYHVNAKEVFIEGKKWVYAENNFDWVSSYVFEGSLLEILEYRQQSMNVTLKS